MGYKIVDRNLRALKGFQYAVGHTASTSGGLVPYVNGLHYCQLAIDCYEFTGQYERPLRFLRVMAQGATAQCNTVSATLDLKVDSEITAGEYLAIATNEAKSDPDRQDTLYKIIAELGDLKTLMVTQASGWRATSDACHAAARYAGDADKVKYLIAKGASLSHACVSAADGGYHDLVRQLVEMNTASRTPQLLAYAQIMHPIAGRGDLDTVKFLVGAGACARDISLALVRAASHDHNEIVKYLLPRADSADTWAIEMIGAARRGNLELVKLLIGKFPRQFYERALEEAAKRSNVDVAEYFTGLGLSSGRAIKRAARKNDTRMLVVLTRANVDTVVLTAALELATRNKHADAVKILTARGAQPHASAKR